MTIEIVVGGKKYHIAEEDPLVVEVQHKHGARWVFYLRRDSANEARAALLQIGKEGAEAPRGFPK